MSGPAGPTPATAGRPHHVGLVVRDLDAAVQHVSAVYARTMVRMPAEPFPCWHEGRPVVVTVPIALSVDGPPHLELLQAVEGTVWTPVAGLHHVAYAVDDVSAEAALLEKMGLSTVVCHRPEPGRPQVATYHRDPLGPIVELLATNTALFFADRLRKR